MLYVSDPLDFKRYETSSMIYNFRLYDAPPREFDESDFFKVEKQKSLYKWQEEMFTCLNCNDPIRTYVAKTNQPLPFGGYVELELYRCDNCEKYTMLELFDS